MNTEASSDPAGFLLGVDGGGTKTIALVATLDGAIISEGEAGASNYQQVGAQQAFVTLESAITLALQNANVASRNPYAVCLGLAGVARQEDRDLVRHWADLLFPGAPLLLTNDGALVLAAGAPDGWGVAVICGTGSIVIGADREGHNARAGGWGPLLGDEGSGHAVGRAALTAVMRAHDGRGPQTVLLDGVLRHLALPEPPALVRRVYQEGFSTADIARLAPLVNEAAEAGDAVASAIIAAAGAELAFGVSAVAQRLSLHGRVPCALAGGFILRSALLRSHFSEAAAARGLHLDPITLVPRPAEGAIHLAKQLLPKVDAE